MTTKMIVDTPRVETTAWTARTTRKRAMPARVLLPLHLHHEEGLVRRRLPRELAPSGVDGEVLVEPDAGDVLLEDAVGLPVVLEPLLLLQRLPSPCDRIVEGGVRVLCPEALALEQGKDHAVGVLAGARPAPKRDAAGLFRLPLATLEKRRLIRLRDDDLEPDFLQHLLDRLDQALVVGGRGVEGDLGALRPGFLEELRRSRRIERIALQPLDVAEVRRGEQDVDRAGVAAHEGVDEQRAIDGVRDGPAHADVLRRAPERVDEQVAGPLGRDREDLQA